MNDYAVCLVTSHHGAVRKAWARKSDAEVAAALAKVSVSDCLAEGRLIMPPQLLRGALYRALYLRDFGKRPPSASASGPMHEDNPLRLFGHCVYAIDPVDVRAFVMADPATALEKEAIAALGPALAQCVSPGSQIRFSPAVLQAILAEAAYRGARESSGIQ
jgi:hypothetical protein